MQTQYTIIAKSHNITNSHITPRARCWSHTEPSWARGELSEAKPAGPGSRTFTTSKAGDIPYSSACLAFELKTASTAPAAMKREGFLPAAAQPRLSRMLTGLCLASAPPPPHARPGNAPLPGRTGCPAMARRWFSKGVAPGEKAHLLRAVTPRGRGKMGERTCSVYHGCTFQNA